MFLLIKTERDQVFDNFAPKQTFQLKTNKIKPLILNLGKNPSNDIEDDLMDFDEVNSEDLIWYQSKHSLQGFKLSDSHGEEL